MESLGKLLIVEDDESLAKYLEDHFSTQFDVKVAYDGQEGYDLACTFHPDCIVSDVRMPKLSGINLVKQVRRTPGLEAVGIILLSVLKDKEDRIRGYESLADLYFSKPFDIDELTVSIIGLITMRRHMKAVYSAGASQGSEPLGDGLKDDNKEFLIRLSEAVEHRLGICDLKVEDIAKAIHVSKRQLERRVKELEGISPSVYIRQVRLEEAKKILSTGTVTNIQDIAYRVGYKDPKVFSKQFLNYFGCSPKSLL